MIPSDTIHMSAGLRETLSFLPTLRPGVPQTLGPTSDFSRVQRWLETARQASSLSQARERLTSLARAFEGAGLITWKERVASHLQRIEMQGLTPTNRLRGVSAFLGTVLQDQTALEALAASPAAVACLRGMPPPLPPEEGPPTGGARTTQRFRKRLTPDRALAQVTGNSRPPSSPVLQALVVRDRLGAREAEALRRGVVEAVRLRAIEAAVKQPVHRDSPYVAQLNQFNLTLVFDLDTGEVLQDRKAAFGKTFVKITFAVLPDHNRMNIDNATLAGLREALKSEDDPRRAAVLSGLLDIDRTPLSNPVADRPALPARGRGTGPIILPRADPRVLAFNKGMLSGQVSAMRMTIMLSPTTESVLGMRFNPAVVTLDSEGKIIATEFAMPDYQSPRGTRYRTGIAVAGERIPVIVYHADGGQRALVWYDAQSELTAKQQSALVALYEDAKTERDQAAKTYPYSIDAILHQGLGRLALDLSRRIGTFYREESKKPRVESFHINLTFLEGVLRVGESQPIGSIEVTLQLLPGARKAYKPFLSRLDFQVSPETPGKGEIERLLAFIRSRLVVSKR